MKKVDAICTHLIAIGSKAKDQKIDGDDVGPRIVIGWKMLDEVSPNQDQRHHVFKLYKLSLNLGGDLRIDITNWLGNSSDFNSFNIRKLLGKCCQLELTEFGLDSSKNFFSVAKVISGLELESVKIQNSELIYFTVGEPNQDLFINLPAELQSMICDSIEYKRIIGSR